MATTGYRNLPRTAAFLLKCAALCVVSAACGAAGEAVLSDIGIQAGPRGVALTLGADLPFVARFSLAPDKSAGVSRVQVSMQGVIYGLSSYSFSEFPSSAPVHSISVRESKGKPGIDLVVRLRVGAQESIAAHRKNGGWVALLSREACEPFTWNAPVEAAPGPASVPSQPQSSAPPAMAGPAAAPPTQGAPSGNRAGTAAGGASQPVLSDVKVLRRTDVAELALEFEAPVVSTVSRTRQTLTVLVPGARSALPRGRYDIPAGSAFRSITVDERVRSGKAVLSVVVELDKAATGAVSAVSVSQGKAHVLYTALQARSVGVWSAASGQSWSHEFVGVKDYQVDMQSIERKAIRDAAQEVAETFSIGGDDAAAAPPHPPAQPVAQPVVQPVALQPAASAAPPPVEAAATSAFRMPLFVVGAKVNLRSEPGSGASSTTIARLSFGDQVLLLESMPPWHKVESGELVGWVHSSLVRDSSSLTPSQRSQIMKNVAVATPPVEAGPSGEPDNSAAPAFMPDTGLPGGAPDSAALPDGSVVIRYRPSGRDPFVPLIRDSLESGGVPRVEDLKLVGILYDQTDRIALLEDIRDGNRPYALREDDDVESGRVLKVYRDNVVFLISEYGISRSYTLRLKREMEGK